MLTPNEARTLAGVVAASGAPVSKQIPFRNPPLNNLSFGQRPSGPGDLPRLFGGSGETPLARMARLSSASLLYSVNKASDAPASQILYNDERKFLSSLHEARAGHEATDRSCVHCRLLYNTLYKDVCNRCQRAAPPIAVVNHSARVNITFDPVTNIAEASIDNFQVIVPESVAMDMLRYFHPLRWADPPGALFRQSDPVNAEGKRTDALRGSRPEVMAAWEQQKEKFIYEDCVWPINENLSGASENIIAFDDFDRTERSLRYEYRLGRSVRSNFGVAWEPSGLDVDAGSYHALVVPVSALRGEAEITAGTDVEATVADLERVLRDLKYRDVLEMMASKRLRAKPYGTGDDADPSGAPDPLQLLFEGKLRRPAQALSFIGSYPGVTDAGVPVANTAIEDETQGPEQATLDEVVEAIRAVATQQQRDWGLGEPFIVNVSASKRLHFTLPENSPIELWYMLTWTAPAFLFAFLNSAICLAPHLMVNELIKSSGLEGIAHD